MSPLYEDAAHLLQFLISGGLPVQPGVSYHRIIDHIASFMEIMCHNPDAMTHADHADIMLYSMLELVDWEQCTAKRKVRTIAATIIGNFLTRRKGQARRSA